MAQGPITIHTAALLAQDGRQRRILMAAEYMGLGKYPAYQDGEPTTLLNDIIALFNTARSRDELRAGLVRLGCQQRAVQPKPYAKKKAVGK